MEILTELQNILADLLDIEAEEIQPDTYVIRDLEVESIDLLELAVLLNSKFKLKVDDNQAFLLEIRYQLHRQKRRNQLEVLQEVYPHIPLIRCEEIVADLQNGPVLKTKDIISYLEFMGR